MDNSNQKLPSKSEWLEYLGLAPADLFLYIAIACTVGGFYTTQLFFISLLFVTTIVTGIVSVKIGSKENREFPGFLNFLKRYVYHISFAVLFIAMTYRVLQLL